MNHIIPTRCSDSPRLRARWPLAAMLAVGLLAGCAQPVQMTKPVVVAAEDSLATQVRRVAVLPFAAPRRDLDASADVETMLASVRVGDQPYFTVVERQRIQDIISQQRFSESALVDPATAVRVGRLIGAEGIYSGAVQRAEVTDRSQQETRNVCARYEQKTRKGVTTDGKCLQWREQSVSCTERTATFAMLPKLVRVQTGNIVFSQPIEGKTTDRHCQGDDGGLASGPEMLASARASAVDALKRQVAPTVQNVTVSFVSNAEGISNPNALARHNGALEFAKVGRTDRACELWREALDLDAGARPLIHNVGACLEVAGQYAQALQAYDRAERAGLKPDKIVTDSIVRVRGLIDNQSKLRSQTGR